ncbi:hypothetical protein RCL1_001887 [Eukaryota sp. TZLM3-RCL]
MDFSFLLLSVGDSLKLWSPSSETPLLHSFDSQYTSVSLSPDKEHYIASRNSAVVDFFHKYNLEFSLVTPLPVESVLISPNSKLFATRHSNSISVYNYSSRTLLFSLPLVSKPTAFSFSKQSDKLAVGCHDGSSIVVDISSGQPCSRFSDTLKRSVTCLELNPLNSQFLAVGFVSGNIIVYNLQRDEIAHTFYAAHRTPVTCLVFSPRNLNLLASVGKDCKIRFFDYRTAKKMVLDVVSSSPFTSIAFHPQGQAVVVGDVMGYVSVFDLRTVGKNLNANGHEIPSIRVKAHDGQVSELAWGSFAPWEKIGTQKTPKVSPTPEPQIPTIKTLPEVSRPQSTTIPTAPQPVTSDRITELREKVQKASIQRQIEPVVTTPSVVSPSETLKKITSPRVPTVISSPRVVQQQQQHVGPTRIPEVIVSEPTSFTPTSSSTVTTVDLSDVRDWMLDLQEAVHQDISGLHSEFVRQLIAQNNLLTQQLQLQREEVAGLRAEISWLTDAFRQQFGTKLSSVSMYLKESSN